MWHIDRLFLSNIDGHYIHNIQHIMVHIGMKINFFIHIKMNYFATGDLSFQNKIIPKNTSKTKLLNKENFQYP